MNVYWLSWNAGTGLRMETKVLSSDIPGQYEPKNFLTRVHFEKDNQFRRFKNFGLAAGNQNNEQISEWAPRTEFRARQPYPSCQMTVGFGHR